MRRLLDFLRKYDYWLLFILLEAASLFMLFRWGRYQNAVWFTSANVVTGRLLEWESDVWAYVHLGARNKELLERNLLLERRVERLTQRLESLEHVPSSGELRQEELLGDMALVHADVVNNSVNRRSNYFTINKGSDEGVVPEMGVVCAGGVAGIVYQTTPHYALVMSLLNHNSNVSCRLRGTDYFGYLHWDGASPLYATLGDIPLHAKVKEGTVVETSGFSAVFPAGLFVGRVKKVEFSEDGLSYQLKVNLGTDFARMRDVCVIALPGRVEQDSLQGKVVQEK